MTLKADVLKRRLKETFGSDSQETIGGKLNMTQGNVSKLISGAQIPTLETVYHVAEEYDVSVDWLLGLSDRKSVDRSAGKVTYATAVRAISSLKINGATLTYQKNTKDMDLQLSDPLLVALVRKAMALMDTDLDFFQGWLNTKLSMFENKPLIDCEIYRDDKVEFLARSAVTESNWLEVYEAAEIAMEILKEVMGDYVSPFSK